MTRITITATDAGFFTNSAIGSPLAPNVFLETRLNGNGTVITFDGSSFVTLESLRYDTQSITVNAQIVAVAAPQLGQQTEVTISSVSFMRLEGGAMVQIGTMALPDPLALSATYLSYGVDDTPSWQFELGTALEDLLDTQNFRFIGGEGNDVFEPHLEQLPFRGNGSIFGMGGDDQLTGTAGSDFISGGADNDTLTDNYGSNELRGGAGDDTLTVGNGSAGSILNGGEGDDMLVSGWGSDTLIGGSGYDTLIGGMGDDTLFGKKGRDTLDGGEGNDMVDGGAGSDLLTGGIGNDVFVFRASEIGRDHITDFEDGIDLIRIEGLSSFADLTLTAKDGNTWITAGDIEGQIIIDSMDIANIEASDFLFA
ncbi:MAG: hypothetical protein L3J37_10440 [Rhodobacteraceae bacterium]|nr:hypothetical protein [Paracoccaceae bacterium]